MDRRRIFTNAASRMIIFSLQPPAWKNAQMTGHMFFPPLSEKSIRESAFWKDDK